MVTIIRPRHRRVTVRDLHPEEFVVADVQNDARCSSFGVRDSGCTGMYCPRHRADDYAENFARHATDSLGPALGSIPTRWMP
jgi:hypothetical protein